MQSSSKAPRSRVLRQPQNARYDRVTVHGILDAGLIGHLAFATDGWPYVIPMLYARDGERLILHGSVASRLMRTLGDGAHACLAVTLLDGFVLARSAFNASVNYRSVVVFGRAVSLTAEEEKTHALRVLSEHVLPGRWADIRPPSPKELSVTSVLAMQIETATAKVRTGPPKDDPDDLTWPCWAGVVPLRMVAGEPEPDGSLSAPPDYVLHDARFR
jgi:nitroimidazol reductase NimA-like FMN-containing flavoprotein (pyridoxamine 5'-phosphate oxidase superfamily)